MTGRNVRRAGDTACRECGETGHYTRTCQRYRGHRFGALVVLRGAPARRRPGGHVTSYVLVRCDCGATKEVALGHLTRKRRGVRSCGCRRVPPDTPGTVIAFGVSMTTGELAGIAGVRTDRVAARLRRGASPEVAALGKALDDLPSIEERACAARVALRDWHLRFRDLRDHPEFQGVFSAVEAAVVTL